MSSQGRAQAFFGLSAGARSALESTELSEATPSSLKRDCPLPSQESWEDRDKGCGSAL